LIRALLFAFLAGTVYAGAPAAAIRPVPRTILAVYDSRYHKDVRDTRIHRLLEMPLNHLGLVVRYRDLNGGLPPVDGLEDVRGILTWFQSDSMEHPEEFLSWAESAIDAGKRFVVIGDLSVGKDLRGRVTPIAAVNHFLAKLGLRTESWTPVTYDQKVVYKDPAVMDFERPLPAVLPSFDRMRPIDPRVRSHLIVRRGTDAATDSHLVVTGPHGGWVADGYTHFASYRQDQLQWYINPFEFLRLAFATDDLPKLDTTTLSGRRIYYSHIDGDGWRNVTEVPAHQREKSSSAEVILKEAIEPFPDLPVTVGPIVGDLDPAWFGTRESMDVARRILAVPWVEAGSHTYSHPLDWESLCQTSPGAGATARRRSWFDGVLQWFDPAQWTTLNRAIERYSRPQADEGGKAALRRGQSRLRSYNLYPFNLDQEIAGSIAFLNRLLPPGKRVEILQWSGTTMVPEAVLRAVSRERVRNINGGDTRFDPEFDSYAWVAPLGRQAGAFRQVYSSDSNENTYTNLWNERYFGYRYLPATLIHTESPIRVKPFNLYYHMYSGEKEPSLGALLANLRYARSQELAPITASRYAAIVDGFHAAAIVEVAPRRWRIDDRDGLDTVRFDRADGEAVDLRASVGVVGERHFQGSLYVALDAAERAPVVALAPPGKPPAATRPYLVESRWQISKLRAEAAGFEFEARGFGPGEMEWRVAALTPYVIRVANGAGPLESLKAVATGEGVLRFTVEHSAIEPLLVRVIAEGGAR
jgi:hypothetical protein